MRTRAPNATEGANYRSRRSMHYQDHNNHQPQVPAHTYNSQPCWSWPRAPHPLSPFTTTPRSKVPSPMIGNRQKHNNNTRIRSSNPPPTHHTLGHTTTQASHKHTSRTQLLSLQSSTKNNNLFTKCHYQSRLSLRLPLGAAQPATADFSTKSVKRTLAFGH